MHDSQTARSLEEDEEDITSSLESPTFSFSQQDMPSSSFTTPLTFNKIQRSQTADYDFNNGSYGEWEPSASSHVTAEPKRHHYLTRSQSALTYPPKSQQGHKRSFSNPVSTSFNPFISSPLRTELDPREPEALASDAPGNLTHRRSQFMLSAPSLSPIEESSSQDRNDDTFSTYKHVHIYNLSLNSSKKSITEFSSFFF